MQIHRVNGKSLRDALERARALHGEHALVLSHETSALGVTVAVTGPPPKEPPPALPSAATLAPVDPGRADVARRLARHGASSDFQRRVLGVIEQRGARGIAAVDVAAEAIEAAFRVATSPKLGDKPAVLAFVGPTGVGKTTTLAKLAAHLVRSRRRIALITTDTHRAGGVEHLSAHARLLQAPLFVARGANEMGQALERARSADAVLVDTAGHSPRDGELLARMAQVLEQAGQGFAQRYLVLPATASRAALEESRFSFAPLDPAALILTKLDETREPAGALEIAAASGMPLAFLCDGQEIAKHLHRARPEHVSSLFLRGRVE